MRFLCALRRATSDWLDELVRTRGDVEVELPLVGGVGGSGTRGGGVLGFKEEKDAWRTVFALRCSSDVLSVLAWRFRLLDSEEWVRDGDTSLELNEEVRDMEW